MQTFSEEQIFDRKSVIGIGALTTLPVVLIGGFYLYRDGNMEVDGTPLITVLVAALFLCGLVLWLILAVKLNTSIDAESIKIKFAPFGSHEYKWEDIKSASVLDYGFIGGWGIRYWTSYGTAYNIKGSMGLAIELNNGKKYLIGTQKEEELAEFIRTTIKQQD